MRGCLSKVAMIVTLWIYVIFPLIRYLSRRPTVIWRAWESLDEDVGAVEPIGGPFPSTKTTLDFTVMSYNILAQDLIELNQELYTHCPLEVLDWKYRCCLFLNELKKWSPDILCLQEVQQNHYYEELHPVLAQMGYTCIYKQRTGTKTDGCAICYKSRHFTEITVKLLEFFQPETELLNRHNVGIVLLLRPVATLASEAKACGPPLCVANTHLLFNPRRGDVKLAQLAIVIAEIDCLIKSCRAKREHCNVILCGDFNSVPNSPLYQLITVGELYYHGMQAWMVSGQKDFSHQTPCHRLFAPLWPSSLGITDHCQYTPVQEDQESPRSGKYQYSHDLMLKRRFYPAACVRPLDLPLIPGVTDHTADLSRKSLSHTESFRKALYHRLDLKSVYEHVLPGSGKPEVTTLNSDVGATVDYIFYSPKRTSGRKLKDGGECASNGLKLMGRLSLLSEEVLWSMNGLPNHVFPSDHLSLLAQFQMQLHPA
ncbi:protein angel homolog 1 isoform X2 [Gouania willdenowi]|uniref:protein angel homolog 1 isoform X2 n=1 Tax=Gouania willdenowi TaxID=441366 RepID=UPI00105625E0|nr:protein angel homolog 1 isoform X2 [Gouania willdenowi]